jgi:DNA-binding NtrC family response regulator
VRGHIAIVSASNSLLTERVRLGKFRQDLYYRLNVTRLILPPLRERTEDIPLLAEHFLRGFASQYGQGEKSLHPESVVWLRSRAWPGNVRELENLLHGEFLMADGNVIRVSPSRYERESLLEPPMGPAAAQLSSTFRSARDKVVRDFEKGYLHTLMLSTGGNVSQAARLAGKERRSLGRLLKKHGILRTGYAAEA